MKSWGEKWIVFWHSLFPFELKEATQLTVSWRCPVLGSLSASLHTVCLPWQNRASKEFSVKDNKTHQRKICLCKIEIFKISLRSNWFHFSLVTILWFQTELNLKESLHVEQKGNFLLGQFSSGLCYLHCCLRIQCSVILPSAGFLLGPQWMLFSYILVFIWKIGILGQCLFEILAISRQFYSVLRLPPSNICSF